VKTASRAPLAEARAFQRALVNHLLREKAPIMDGTTPEPHITINYRGDRLGSQTFGALKLPPIGWTVDEIILTESIVAKTTHVEHGRWLLGGT
jgi:RNA 2',3'-cyclic 3'-phosphodiesterase